MDPTAGSSNMDRIEGSCCVVTVSRSAARQPASSCSGVILDHGTGTVLCSGFPFSPFVDLSGATDGSGRWFVLPDGFTARPDVRVHVHAPGAPPRHAEPLMLIRCREFSDAFRALFRDSDQWRFHNDDDDHHDPEGSGSDGSGLLGWFAVLRADPDPRPCPVNRVPRAASASLRKGAAVVACGSPFGALCPDLFANALSAGIVSNLCGEDNAVILTDARCLPGTEGGGLFVMDDDGGDPRLVGVIVSSLCWKGAEWVGLTLVCSLHLILRNIREVDVNSPLRELSCLHGDAPQGLQLLNTASSSSASASSASSSSSPGWREYPTVCLVDGGRVWGSGVVVAARLVLTCRHVVNGQKTVGLRFHQQQGRSRVVVGDVLFSTKPSSSYDLAVVQLRDDAPEAVVPVVAKSFRPGEEVVVVGYGGLGKSCGPSLTGGILSKAVSWDGLPVMLQTTCAVQAGASGGAVVRKHSGELLGIVSSNTKDCAANVTYPHLNFSIPGTVFQPLLQRFNQTGDTEAFRDLDASDARVRRVWRLQNPPSKL